MRKKNKIKITVNGKQTIINSNFSLKNLVDKLEIPLNKIAIEYNREILRDQLINVHEDDPEADVDHMFTEIWNHVDPVDYDDPPRGWIPKNAEFRVEGEMQGRMPR